MKNLYKSKMFWYYSTVLSKTFAYRALFLILFTSLRLNAQPANDNVCDAISLTLGAASSGGAYTNVNATIEAGEFDGPCYFNGNPADNSVWFTFVAPASGSVQINTRYPDGTLTDSQLLLYDVTDCTMAMYNAILACDEDDDTDIDTGGTPQYNAILEYSGLNSGEIYYISVDGYDGATGTFDIGVFESTDPFITTWQTTYNNESIAIPTLTGGNYNYNVDWGDGIITTGHTGDASHTYTTPGTYDVQITGLLSHIYFFNATQEQRDKIIDIKQWGSNEWNLMARSFFNCSNLQMSATDAPNLSNVSDMQFMFSGASSFNTIIDHWDVSNVINMIGLFQDASAFDQPMNNWDVSNVLYMNSMFRGASSFNQPLDNWNVSNVINMSGMLRGTSVFNQPLNNWDVSNVTGMSSLFYGATLFNQPLDNWNTTSATNMAFMFHKATSFNQPLNNWDTSKVTSTESMFWDASSFNQPLDNWDMSMVTNMRLMFLSASSFNQPLDNWDASNVTNMSSMFANTSAFNQPFNNWNVSNVTNMSSMFSRATAFNQPLNNWDVSNVTNMSLMFSEAHAFNQPLINWNVSSVTDMSSMFNIAFVFNQSLDNWDVSNVTTMFSMFRRALNFNQPLDNWNVSNVVDMRFMFNKTENFNQPLNNWDVSNVTEMNYMFSEASAFNQPLDNWDMSSVNNMQEMFSLTPQFNQSLASWDVSNVTDMTAMIGASNMSTENYDLILQAWSALPNLQSNVNFGAQDITYCSADNARDNLLEAFNWSIIDAGLDCSTLSINSTSSSSLKLYPNPASDFIEISGETYLDHYHLYDMLGKLVTSGSLENSHRISVLHLEKGMYFLQFDSGATAKFLKN